MVEGRHPTRRVERVEALALGAALTPVVVAVARAAATGWMPVGDAAYFTVRSRDVLGAHWPLVGAWSSGSAVVGVPVNNLGPLQLDLLAPFTKVTAYLGTGIGAAVVNALAITLVWWAARRLFGPRRVVVVMTGTLVLTATLGLSWLLDARQQYALVLPFYALLWLTAAMGAGAGAAVPLGLAVASLVVQTHFTYAYQAVIVTAAGVVAYAGRVLVARPPGWRRVVGWSGGVLAVAWIQPILDQLFGSGNLGEVLGPARGGQSAAGLSTGLQVVAGGALVPPFWLPGSIGLFLQPHDGVSRVGAAVSVGAWAAAAGALVVAGRRRGATDAVALGAATLVALGAGVAGAALIPVSMFGLVPQNYYWVWAIGAFASIALATGAWSLVGDGVRRRITAVAGRRAVLATVLAVAVAAASWPRYPVASVAFDEAEARRVGEPLRRALERAFTAPSFPDTVEVDFSRAFFGNNYPYVVLTELQRAGVEFRFVAGSRNLDRFGDSRCVTPGALPRLFLLVGRNPTLAPGSRVLARVVGITGGELDEYAALQARFGDLLRDGAVTVDVDAVVSVLADPVADLDEVLATPGRPARGLARHLDAWRRWGYVEVPAGERAAFDRWVELEHRALTDFQTVVLLPPGSSEPPDGPAPAC